MVFTQKEIQRRYAIKHRLKLLEKQRQYRRTHPDKMREYKRRYNSRYPTKATERMRRYCVAHARELREYRREKCLLRKKKAYEIVAHGKMQCVGCGCSDIRVLDINHINGGGTREGLSGQRICLSIISGDRKTDDLNLLCKNCNWLHYLERIEEKGTVLASL